VAALTRLAGVPSEVAFNLAIALLFALTANGAFSLTYNLVARREGTEGRRKALPLAFGALGAVFVAVMGNLEGLLEVLHTRGLGSSSFWEWIDVKDLASASVSGSWIPTDNWWWWRASRVVHDVVLGMHQEVIDEFPFFSFLLGDMHPHVLGLPFVLLALGLCLNLLWSHREAAWWEMVLLGLCFGGLGFLNSWDLPIYLAVCVVVYGLASYARQEVLGRRWLTDVGSFAVTLVTLCFILYLPFWIGLRSQAGGIERVELVQTRFHQYLIMFGAFIYVCVSFLGYELWRTVRSLRGISSPAAQTEDPQGMSMGGWRAGSRRLLIGCLAFLVLYVVGACLLVATRLERILLPIPGRFDYVWLLVFVGLGLAVLTGRLGLFGPKRVTSSSTFVLVLFLAALSLTLSVEFVFLKDVFGTRMNTVFKFYYQAWVLFGISSAFGVYYLGPWIRRRRRVLSGLLVLGFVPIFLAGMVYPVLSTYTKTGGFRGPRTLDGMAYLETAYSDELAAIRWLRDNVEDAPTIVEATGGAYSYYGRVSVHTGLPTLLGWGGHEQQWRGNYEEPGRREPDIKTIYTSPDVGETAALLDEYDIQYVYVGPLERSTYQVSQPVLAKFERLMDVVFQQGEVTIYGRR
jgi:YYY domain-containing protein